MNKTFSLLLLIASFACQNKQAYVEENNFDTMNRPVFPYQLTEPNRKMKMPSELEEISGISFWDEKTLACVQDEEGRIYFYDIEKEELEDEKRFAKDGDFEDVEVVGKTIYALRSDGKIYELKPEDDWEEEEYKTELSDKHDTEGLCFHSQANKLLIACKEVSGIEDHQMGYKSIFMFDLATSKLDEKPFAMISIDQIAEIAGRRLGFAPSGIAFHPKTNDLYVISSVGKLLIVLDSAAQIKHLQSLDTDDFKQPEGICFAPDGTLYISNEGRGGKGNILEFKPID